MFGDRTAVEGEGIRTVLADSLHVCIRAACVLIISAEKETLDRGV
jgi:hypothetical protein